MPPRQSARVSAKLAAANTSSLSTSHQTTLVPSARSETHPRKKQKVAVKVEAQPAVPLEDDFRKIKGRRGVLKTMTEMPVDILLEIFSQLEPVDLLHLSRATKALRLIIMDNNASFLWQQVYTNVPLLKKPPACPPGMKLVLYANLIYGRHCHFCASGQAKIVHWTARVRMCSKCAPKQLILQIKTGKMASMCSPFFLKKSTMLDSGFYVLKAEHEQRVRRYNEIEGEEAKLEYKNAAATESIDRMAQGRVLSHWERTQKRHRSRSIRWARDSRRQAIIGRVQEEGYGVELARYQVDRLPGVNVASELTDKAWERIKHNILDVLENERQEIMKQNIINDFSRRIRHVVVKLDPAMENMARPRIIPPISHFARSEPFCALIKDNTIDEAQFQTRVEEMVSHIPDMAAAWRSEADNFLVDLIRGKEDSSSSSFAAASVNPLELAVTFFKCRWCDDPIRYPRVLMHRCLRDRQNEKGEERSEEDKEEEDHNSEEDDDEEDTDENGGDGETSPKGPAEGRVIPVTPDGVWNEISSWYGSTWNEGGNQVFVDEEASGFATAIVKVCGEDPKTVTLAKMEENDARLECVRCSAASKHKPRSRPTMNWRMAILHDIEVHYEDPPAETGWKLLIDEADLAKVKQCESKMFGKWKAPDYNCRHCDRTMSGKAIKHHMDAFHHIKRESEEDQAEITFKDDVYLPLDTSMKIPPYAVKI